MYFLDEGETISHKEKAVKKTAMLANKDIFKGSENWKNRIFKDKRSPKKIVLRTKAFFSFSTRLTKENQTKNKIRRTKTVSPATIHTFMGLN
jgi:hypothetical protein